VARKKPQGNMDRTRDSKSQQRKKEPDRLPIGRATVPPALHDPEQRAEWKLPKSPTKPGPYMVELNLLNKEGLQECSERFKDLYTRVLGEKPVDIYGCLGSLVPACGTLVLDNWPGRNARQCKTRSRGRSDHHGEA
jgi:hypothetical protein